MSQPLPFGKYYLLERINVGGMAEVFKAKAFGVEGFERLLALKRILPNIAEDEEFITMFIDEAKIAVQLQHANIAQIFDLGKVDDSFFIALEYVHGKDLRAIFDHFRKTSDRMPSAQVCYVMMQVCEGLDYAHNKRDSQGRELGLVHRDVSPQNVLVGYEGEIKLIDFGIAKAAGKASKTQAGILKGKFGYMSPEQVRGLPVDRRSDVFAAGICLYEMLTGERLFIGESDFSTLEKVRNVEILPPSSFNKKIAPELERIVLKALAKDAEDRYQNAIDLHDDLQAYLYSTGEFFSRKDLAQWMRKIFASEIADETARNAQWEQLEQPTPVPFMGESRRAGSGGAVRSHGLDWDDEELETQIFDRIPGTGPDALDREEGEVDDRSSELSSSDIMLTDVGSIVNSHDDKTAIAPPPDEAQLAYDPMGEDVPMGFGQGMPAPGMTNSPYGQNLLGGPMAQPLPPGPPPGLSAYRQTSPMPVAGQSSQWVPSPQGHPMQNGGGYPAPGSPFRQTIMGLPQVATPAYQPPPPPQPQAKQSVYSEAAPGHARRRRFPILGTLIVMGLALGGMVLYTFMNRPGRLEIDVSPSGASIALNGVLLKGIPPFRFERPPGIFKIEVVQDGYTKEERRAEVKPGGFERVKIDLRPSPNTGFELTSDPPGQLVWMDGSPFTGIDPNGPQARTDFKATRVTPGRHLLEIKGDPRFRSWRHEFYQEPGRVLQIRATLYPETGHGPAPGSKPGAEAPRPVEPEPVRAVTPPPPPTPTPRPPAPAPAAVVRPATAASTPPVATTPPASTASTTPSTPKPAATPRPTTPKPATAAASPGSGETPAATETPARATGTCVMTIGAKPWAEVWIDGRNTQKVTPLVDLKVPCGKHRITLKNPELQVEKSEQVTIRPGEKWKKIFQLLDEE